MAARFLANDLATSDGDGDGDGDGGPNTTSAVGTHTASGAEHSDAEDVPGREWYGDSAYGTGDLRDALGQAGHTAIIKPKPVQSPVAGGFTIDDFAVDEDGQTVTCPAGHTRPISPTTRTAAFGALCRTCPLRDRCTKSKTGRKIVLHEHDALLRQARRDWTTDPTLRERYRRHRPNIERVIAQVASRGGRRLKLRYRGVEPNNAWLKRRTAALNLRNLINRGLHYTNGWALTTC
ncbi:transposase [Micromonospora sp. NBC_00898]|uniref:transposase n=1 Tax=Micromonospora sp. NBC_00898 TaxID=2975981 RepID=UPI00386D18E3